MAKENIEKNIPKILNPKFKKRVFLNCNVIFAILIRFFIIITSKVNILSQNIIIFYSISLGLC